ncbi:unnamed protein product [Caretta caretta]
MNHSLISNDSDHSKDHTQNCISVGISLCALSHRISLRTLPKMAEVTYADLKFMTLEQPRNQEPNEAKVKDVRGSIYLSIPFLFFISESPPPSPYWRLAAEILGIFCLGLLVTAGVLSVKFTQVSQLVSEWHENLTQKREILGNLTQQLEFLQAQNLNLSETVQQLASYRGHRCSLCPENWLQHGENCYFLSTKWKTWQESKALCSSLDSRFLKIESFVSQKLVPVFTRSVCQFKVQMFTLPSVGHTSSVFVRKWLIQWGLPN